MSDRQIIKFILLLILILSIGITTYYLSIFFNTEYDGATRKILSKEEYLDIQNFVPFKNQELKDNSLRKLSFKFQVFDKISLSQLTKIKVKSCTLIKSLTTDFSKVESNFQNNNIYELKIYLSNQDNLFYIIRSLQNFLKSVDSKINFNSSYLNLESFNDKFIKSLKLEIVQAFEIINIYQSGNFIYTSGMDFFGFPDLYIKTQVNEPRLDDLLKQTCHLLVNNQLSKNDGSFKIELNKSLNYETHILDNSKNEIFIHLGKDNLRGLTHKNRLLRVRFFKKKYSQDEAMIYKLDQLFGKKEVQLDTFKISIDLQVALLKVQTKAPYLKQKFINDKLDLLLLVQLPGISNFNEWIWVKVISWKNKTITAILQSKSTSNFNLLKGSSIKVKEASIKDYQLYQSGLFVSGNITEGLYSN
ncbi:MAG: hypothetical protein COB02_16910 [Candidatus Cloacimonadota bacterium]|nr:MAG: hypothetical protein COB02_18420 [Candidatus Cloacimonadota bacterium]PCJ16118.1 MAG: hypothetical protein COB02_16910 [Candidatus Cloacimonadota bacterium]